MNRQGKLPIPREFLEIVAVRKLEHYFLRETLIPNSTPSDASRRGFQPLSKTFNTRYADDCANLNALKVETERDFECVVVLERKGVSLWKRSRSRV